MIDFIRAYGYTDSEIAAVVGLARETITRIRALTPGYIGVGIEEALTRVIHNLTASEAPQVSYAPLPALVSSQAPQAPQRQPAPVPIPKEHAHKPQPVTIAAPVPSNPQVTAPQRSPAAIAAPVPQTHKPGGVHIDGAYCSSCHRLISGRAYAVPGQPIGRYTQYLCEEHAP